MKKLYIVIESDGVNFDIERDLALQTLGKIDSFQIATAHWGLGGEKCRRNFADERHFAKYMHEGEGFRPPAPAVTETDVVDSLVQARNDIDEVLKKVGQLGRT